jgi:hypothetical protein
MKGLKMILTVERTSRYLGKLKKFNDYLLKINTKDRKQLLALSELRANLLKSEEKLRELQETLLES